MKISIRLGTNYVTGGMAHFVEIEKDPDDPVKCRSFSKVFHAHPNARTEIEAYIEEIKNLP